MAPLLPNLRIGFACKQSWDDMVGDDRVRECRGCDRQVFNLSAMTREEAEALLATRGLTPCVRFYRRPDGTVMTTDCPTRTRREKRRLTVVASSFAAIAAAPPAMAEPPPTETEAPPVPPTQTIDDTAVMGVPEMGVIIAISEPRPAVEWSLWGRLGIGVASHQPRVLARTLTPPMAESSSTFEAAAAAELTFRVARNGDVRLGAWGELRTSSGPVVGGELVVEGLPPHPYVSRIDGSGSLVLRAGGNAHVVSTALGFGYVGSWPRHDPWIPWARHVVGARLVAAMNRSLDDPREWSATVGVEIEPIGVVHAVLDLATRLAND
jgi:hypothetical protein